MNGIHHITAISADPQRTVDFYTEILGLRLVKKTVNFDDPSSYHLYFGNEVGSPSTVITFFPFKNVAPGRRGPGQVAAITFAVPAGSLNYWSQRFPALQIDCDQTYRVFESEVLPFSDPDGMRLEIIARDDDRIGWDNGDVPVAHSIRGIYGATLWVHSIDPTATMLTKMLHFESVGEVDGRHRFTIGDGKAPGVIDVIEVPMIPEGVVAAGSVHHIAWRTPDDSSQKEWMMALREHGVATTDIRDRDYFRSVYFREPGGILYEIATDTPGFATDETVGMLGTSLQLPAWLHERRAEIEASLPVICISDAEQARA